MFATTSTRLAPTLASFVAPKVRLAPFRYLRARARLAPTSSRDPERARES